MILINVKFPVKPEYVDEWPRIIEDFTRATREEPGNLWFEWSRSLEDPNTFVLLEAFTDDGAEPHVTSEHFRVMQREFPQYLAATPQIVSRQVEGEEGWGPMGELSVED
ncbi:antibiotic biosynthesis monooxygenase [Brachybacterium sp. EF45031]|uniref:putative quinol monooxygenase n=1 Tax=Brachybacterium sillae TaxID=2810536 RepID=UPI00217CE646|nr:putative quinol monooxygenase [Brachybacterium sillae]MCS6711146.1 antibiotic biosynthesis monooxygenase [Brachybacterium sillae]